MITGWYAKDGQGCARECQGRAEEAGIATPGGGRLRGLSRSGNA